MPTTKLLALVAIEAVFTSFVLGFFLSLPSWPFPNAWVANGVIIVFLRIVGVTNGWLQMDAHFSPMVTLTLAAAGVVPKADALARFVGQMVVAPAILVWALSALPDTTVAQVGTIPFATHVPMHHAAATEAFAVTLLLVAIFEAGMPYIPEITGSIVAGFVCPGMFGIPVSMNPAYTAVTAMLNADTCGSLASLPGTLLAGAVYGGLRLQPRMMEAAQKASKGKND